MSSNSRDRQKIATSLLLAIMFLFADLALGGFAIAHNGNLTNGLTIRLELVKEGAIFQSTSDTETILQLVAKSKRNLSKISVATDSLYNIKHGIFILSQAECTSVSER